MGFVEVGVGADVERCEIEEEIAGDDVTESRDGECPSGCGVMAGLATVVRAVGDVPICETDG